MNLGLCGHVFSRDTSPSSYLDIIHIDGKPVPGAVKDQLLSLGSPFQLPMYAANETWRQAATHSGFVKNAGMGPPLQSMEVQKSQDI